MPTTPGIIPGTPEVVLQRQIDLQTDAIQWAVQGAAYAREDAARLDADAARLTEERAAYQAALARLKGDA